MTFSSEDVSSSASPGETEEDFAATLDLIRKVGYMQPVHLYLFQAQLGTPAARIA